MYSRFILVSATLLFTVELAISQAVSHADCGRDGKSHVAYKSGRTKIIPTERQQVGCEQTSVARDRHTVAWAVLVENCCTSYPIPTSLVVYRDSHKHSISNGQMVWKWRFIGQGERIAVLFGPVHGWAAEADLYDSSSGKLLASWGGGGSPPGWAAGWQDNFEH